MIEKFSEKIQQQQDHHLPFFETKNQEIMTSESIEDITDVIGKYGPWQKKIFAVVFFVALLVAWQHMVVPFFAPNIDYWCERPQSFQNWTAEEWRNFSSPVVKKGDADVYDNCKIYKLLDQNGSFSVDYNTTVTCTSWEYNRTEYQATIIEEWNLVCQDSWMVSMAQSSYMIGNLVAAICLTQLSDRFGRRPMLLLAAFILLLAGIVCAFSPTFIVFAICRFLLALGTTGLFLNDFVLLMEVVGPEYRPILGVALELGWATGYVLLPGIAYLFRNWVHIQLAITIPVVLLISMWWLMPESPRWLILHGKLDVAKKIVTAASKANGIHVENVEGILGKLSDAAHKKKESQSEKRETVLDLLKSSNLRKKTLVIYFNWFVNAFIFYGLSLNTNELQGNAFVNFAISGAVEFPAYIISIFIIKYLGRRYPQMSFMIIGGLACLATIPVPTDLIWLKTTLAMLGKFCITASYAVIYVYSAEIYPTVVRTVALGSSSFWSKIGSIIAPFTRELGRYTQPSVPFWLYGGLSIVSGLLILLLPETNNRKLPDTIDQAEKFETSKPKTDNLLEMKYHERDQVEKL